MLAIATYLVCGHGVWVKPFFALLPVICIFSASCDERKKQKAVAPLVAPKRDWVAEILEHKRREAEAELIIEQERQAERLKQQAALRLQVAEQDLREAQGQMEAERRERKRQRRAVESTPAPMSPTDPRRLVAAGSTEFATVASSEHDAEPRARRRRTTATQALELRQTGNYFTDQNGNMHRITTLPGEGNFMIGDDLEVRGNNAFGTDGQSYRVRRDSTGRVFIEP